jgi:hypothetical protein
MAYLLKILNRKIEFITALAKPIKILTVIYNFVNKLACFVNF